MPVKELAELALGERTPERNKSQSKPNMDRDAGGATTKNTKRITRRKLGGGEGVECEKPCVAVSG